MPLFYGGVAHGAFIADNEAMRRVLLSAGLALANVLTACAACDGPSSFEPELPDAGGGGDVVTAADIGTPCVYDFADPNKSPASDCKTGLACLIFTSDNEFTSGLELAGWDDQFTVYGSAADVGMCTLQGTLANPPLCPSGTVFKLLFPDVAICVRACSTPADCGRADYTCDARYFDTAASLCVRKCTLDVPDCVRSGIIEEPPGSGQLIPALAFQDLAGESQCNLEQGVCEVVLQRGLAGPGEPCAQTADCEAGSACLQGPLLDATLATNLDPLAPGFCGSPCTPVDASQDPQSNCSVGFVCQAGGNLNLNFNLLSIAGVPGPFALDLSSGLVDGRGGFCFHQCGAFVESACASFPGTACGSFDEAAANVPWNGLSQCLPDALRL